MFLPDRVRTPSTSQFAVRVAVLSGIALALFSVIFFRLWYLQVLSGDRYLEEAQNNRVREIQVQAPRGEILDRHGDVLVDNRTALALQVQAEELPPEREQRERVLRRVAELAGMSLEQVRKEIREQTKELPASPVTLKREVDYPLVYYLQEHQAELPGRQRRAGLRAPLRAGDARRAHLRLRQRGERRAARGAPLSGPVPGDLVGQTGLEYEYDHLLRGQNGATRVQVDATGSPQGQALSSQEAVTGNNLRTTLDTEVQAAGEAALSQFGGLPGAFVAMDVQDGEILGLGSYPTFDPAIFTRPSLSPAVYKRLSSEESRRAARRTARSRASIRPARRSRRSPRSPASRRG